MQVGTSEYVAPFGMERAWLHLRGGRSIHIHSLFVKKATATIEEVREEGELEDGGLMVPAHRQDNDQVLNKSAEA
jgi:hypothetical protein